MSEHIPDDLKTWLKNGRAERIATTRIPDQHCSRCGFKFTATTYFFGDRHPRPGDVSICIECRLVQIFNTDLTLRDPTPDEKVVLNESQQVLDLQLAAALLPPRPKRK